MSQLLSAPIVVAVSKVSFSIVEFTLVLTIIRNDEQKKQAKHSKNNENLG